MPEARDLPDLASNDCLGLARYVEVIEGAVAAARQWGTGATGSRLVTGSIALHAALERSLAGFLGEPGLAVAAQRIFADHGVRAGCFRLPSVLRDQSCLRLTAQASLTEADFTAATQALAAVRDHVGRAAPVGRK